MKKTLVNKHEYALCWCAPSFHILFPLQAHMLSMVTADSKSQVAMIAN